MKTKLLFITFILMATCFQLNAATVTWDGGGDNINWSDPLNWDTDTVPVAGDDVVISGSGSVVTLTGTHTVRMVTVSSSADLTIASGATLTIDGATLDHGLETTGSGNVIINNGTINVTNISTNSRDGIYSKGTFTNNGTIDIDGVTGTDGDGIYVAVGTFTNSSGSTITINNVGDDSIRTDDNSGTPAIFSNEGTITITQTTGDDGIYVNDSSTFNNTGLITVSGTGGDNGMRVDDGGTFNNNSGGTLTINATQDDQLFLDSTGLFNNTGTINLNNSVDVGLFITDESVFTNNTGGTITITDAGDSGLYIDGNTTSSSPYPTPNPIVNNSGTITVNNGAGFDGIRLNDDATLNNLSGGIITLNNSGDEGIQLDLGCTINNSGTIDIITPVDHGMECFGAFNNLNGGIFKATGCPDDGIRLQNTAVFTNDGAINIDGSVSEDIETETVASFVNTANATFTIGSGPGDLEIRDDFDLGAATVTFEINGLTATTDYDQIKASTSLETFTVGASTKINLVWGFTPAIGNTFTIIDASGTLSGTIDIANVTSKHTVTVTVVGNDLVVEVTELNSTWTGGNSSVTWNDALNWSDGIPISTTNVTIPSGLANYPTVTTAETINSLTIASGATLVATNAGFTVTNNASYTRNLASGTQWYLMSSPVNVENFDNAWVTSNSIPSSTLDTDNRGISWYDNTSSDTDSDGAGTSDSETGFWRYMEAGDDTPFAVGAGYGIIRSSAGNIEFIGSGIYTSDQTRLLQTGVNNFNLVGNTFTGFITLGTFHTTNTAVIGTDFYFWNGSSYVTRTSGANPTYEIAPGQGFFVEASSASNVTFEISDVSHQGTDTFQKSANRPEIALNVKEGNNIRYANILYIDGTTSGYDIGYDGKLFGGISHSFALYTHLVSNDQGVKYQLQSLPNSNHENMIVPVGVKSLAGKEITFSATSLNLPEGLNIFLEDRAMNIFTNLDEGDYKVTLSESIDGVGRFFLHTSSKSALSVDNNLALDNISIYKSDASTLRIVGLQQGNTSVKLFNVLGKQIMNSSFIANGTEDVSLPNLAKGVYIVQLETGAGKLNKKIVLE